MSLASRSIRFFLAVLTLTSVACSGEPPEQERQQAQSAIAAARAAGADQYAPQEFSAAQVALQHSNEAVEQRDYRLALNHALDSRERALAAAKMAIDGKTTARAEADRAISSATTTLSSVRSALANAESSRTPARLLAGPRQAFAAADRQLQEARTAYEQEDYPRATSVADATIGPLTGALKDLQTATAAPARRRR